MAQLKTTKITGDLTVTGTFNPNNVAYFGSELRIGSNIGSGGNAGVCFGPPLSDGSRAFLYVPVSTNRNFWIMSNANGSGWRWDNLTNIGINASSDKRLKINIHPSEIKALKVIEQMKPKAFQRIDENNKYYNIGFIADELEMIDKNLVSGGGYGPDKIHPCYKTVNTLLLTSYAIKGIQELEEEVFELRQENNKLKKQIEEINSKLEQIS